MGFFPTLKLGKKATDGSLPRAFTYSIREKDKIINYVKKQKQHHKKETFYDEYKRLLIENEIEFDEKYLL